MLDFSSVFIIGNAGSNYFLSRLQYRHLKCSLSKYCAQSPNRSPFASFSPNHPVCQLINFLALLQDILQERQPLKLESSNPMPESVAVEHCLYLKERSNTTQDVFDALFIFCNSNNILFKYFLCIGSFSPMVTIYNQIGCNVKNYFFQRQNPQK